MREHRINTLPRDLFTCLSLSILYMISMISNLSDLSLPNAGAQDQSVAARLVYVSISLYI
jgi:hypothetical protein